MFHTMSHTTNQLNARPHPDLLPLGEGDRALAVIVIVMLVTLLALANARAEGSRNAVAATVRPLHAAGIDNFYQLTSRIYSGAAPEGDAAFAELKRLGVKTIITVDGAKPDVAMAEKFGIRYVHLPVGYDGVPAKQALRLVIADRRARR
jgi:hypothetical protein